jgi:ATP phosphoribosyltransferase regulatory subunit
VTLPAEGAAALSRIAATSGARVEPQTLMDAEIILELSGEAVRTRLCTFTDGNGREHCLRNDLTTPIAQQVALGALPVARYHASGQVYRLPARGSDEPVEHMQIGFEWFGNGGSPQEDAEAPAIALDAAGKGGVKAASVRFGDVAIYHALLQALPLSPQWRDRLRRAFSRRKGPRELLEAAKEQADVPDAIASIGRLSSGDAERAVEAALANMGVEPVGRSIADIADRLRDKASDTPPDAASSAAIDRYLTCSAPLNQTLPMLAAFAGQHGVKLDAAIEPFRERLDLIEKLDPPFWPTAVFSAEAGRRFEYYDGFVFDLARTEALDRPIVSGGRYDGLISRLSGGTLSASAIGAALRVDRLGGAS